MQSTPRRRGQEFRSSAPVLVLLIGLILVLYILFLPPAQRESLLSGSGGDYGPGGPGGPSGPITGSVSGGTVLMDKYLGTLLPLGNTETEHQLPATTVFTAKDTREVKFIDSLEVRRGAFSHQDATLTFNADVGSSTGYLLTFNVAEASGPLIILLNGHPIFDRRLTTRSPQPIPLPQEYIQPENTITFSSRSAGWVFWRTNTYELRNILVSANIINYQSATSEQHFTIAPDEYGGTEKGEMIFVPECKPKEAGRLSISINGKLLYAGLPDCGVLTHQDIAKELLTIGDNRVGFTSNQGSYTIDRAKIVTHLQAQEYPTLYFNLPPDMFAEANVFAGRVVVTLRFSDGNTVKQGDIVINGFKDMFQTHDYNYQATLDPNVLIPNANSIQIIPENGKLDIPEIRVELMG